VAFAELRREAFEEPDLVFLEFDLSVCSGFLQPQKPLMLGEEVVALPDTPDPAGGHGNPLQPEFLFNTCRTMARVFEGMVENDGLNLGRHPVGMWSPGAGHAVKQPFRAIGLEVPPDLVELLAGIARDLAGP
jgi:hypothetical protein